MESTKTSAALEAFLRLAREHRRYVRELSRVAPPPPPEEPKPYCLPDEMKPILKEAEGILEACLEPWPEKLKRLKREAAKSGRPYVPHPGAPLDPDLVGLPDPPPPCPPSSPFPQEPEHRTRPDCAET